MSQTSGVQVVKVKDSAFAITRGQSERERKGFKANSHRLLERQVTEVQTREILKR